MTTAETAESSAVQKPSSKDGGGLPLDAMRVHMSGTWERPPFVHHNPGAGIDILDTSQLIPKEGAHRKVVVPYRDQLWVRIMVRGIDESGVPGLRAPVSLSAGQCAIIKCEGEEIHCNPMPGQHYSHVSLALSPEAVSQMIGDMRLPEALAKFIEGRSRNFVISPQATPEMRLPVQGIRAIPFSGSARRLFLQAKVLEMLSSVVDLMDEGQAGDDRILGRERRRLLAARDLLLANLSSIPDIIDIARQVGTSPRRLNEIFRREFGMTAAQWLHEHRMETAARLLALGELPIKEIAFRLGYSHRSAFAAAFAQRFGMPPAGYRDGQGEVHRINCTSS